MIIIVEGIDRVGKTTLCNKLKEEFDVPILHHESIISNNKKDNENETDKSLLTLEVCDITNSSIILDRFHLSDFVYGTIERNYNIDSAIDHFKMIDNILSEMNDVFLIYVLPTDIQESSKQHGKNLKIYDNEFYDLFKHSKIKNKWRCTYNTLNEVIEFIKVNVKEAK